MDATNWLLLIAAAAVLLAISLKKTVDSRRISASLHEPTRRHAQALIPPASERAQADLFRTQQSPLSIHPTPRLAGMYRDPAVSSFDQPIADALWVHQRALLLRLESELEMHQQAECSAHLAIAAPTNQPNDLLTEALRGAEESLEMMCQQFEAPRPLRLWHGRALLLMLSNRRFFDHVAWLMNIDLARSGGGACVQAQDGVVLIPIYATRVSDTRRIVLRQLVRAFCYAYGGAYGTYPNWIEHGLARWVEVQRLGLPQADAAKIAAELPVAVDCIIDPAAWTTTAAEGQRHEALTYTSYRAVDGLMRESRSGFIQVLRSLKSGPSDDQAFQDAFATSIRDVLTHAANSVAAVVQEPGSQDLGPYKVISSRDLC